MENRQMNDIGKYLAEEKGYTLPELLTVMAIAGFLSVMVMSVWQFGQGSFQKWNSNVQMVNKLHVMANGLSEEVYRAKEIREVEYNRLVLIAGGDSLLVYKMEDGDLLRNDREVSSGVIEIVDLQFQKLEKNVETNAESVYEEVIRFAVGIDLTVAAGGDTLSASRVVYPRKPVLWKLEGLPFIP
jgi:prepilin-type N-terminal cleavage/methylation domain-containing protein